MHPFLDFVLLISTFSGEYIYCAIDEGHEKSKRHSCATMDRHDASGSTVRQMYRAVTTKI